MEEYNEANARVVGEFLSATADKLKAYTANAAAVQSAASDASKIIAELDKYEQAQFEFAVELSAMRAYVSSRIPEMKEEDNAGVRVQEWVLDILGKLLGSSIGSGSGDDKSGGSRSLVAKPSKVKYLKEKAGMEKDCNDKEKGENPTMKLAVAVCPTLEPCTCQLGLI
eukprot:TRINITY_DN57616_c0_g1_i1.p1 TRINITY_DN57616_c0_g1~~TRINITY_DN57616_c0_g1_i1.p1  ORF type:complete len:168 (+),score=37.93 TRINITY_DN57616_c0_g1_i1:68-571(+)